MYSPTLCSGCNTHFCVPWVLVAANLAPTLSSGSLVIAHTHREIPCEIPHNYSCYSQLLCPGSPFCSFQALGAAQSDFLRCAIARNCHQRSSALTVGESTQVRWSLLPPCVRLTLDIGQQWWLIRRRSCNTTEAQLQRFPLPMHVPCPTTKGMAMCRPIRLLVERSTPLWNICAQMLRMVTTALYQVGNQLLTRPRNCHLPRNIVPRSGLPT